MLKTIVENNQINLRKTFSNNPNPLHSFFAYRNQYFGMFQFNLFGFITDGTHRCIRGYNTKSFGFAAIPSGQNSYMIILIQIIDQTFRNRCFTSPSHR